MSDILSLPASMEPFREQLLNTSMPFIRAKTGKERPLKPWQSKIGGLPYMPKNMTWPATPGGQPLFFLAQINFSEMPALSPFPDKGIVQFFICDDDLYGMDFDDGENPDTFRVIYHPDVMTDENLLVKKPVIRDYEEDLLPHHPDESYPLTFSLEESVVPVADFRFYHHFGTDFFRQFGEKEWDVIAEYERAVRATGHRLGGYA
ncbi:MAG: YwqG family protein, partial [Bacteroidota bacterium]